MAGGDVRLEAVDLCKRYDGREALSHVSFSVRGGEFLSVLGPSGCGKTTLLRILIGLLPPDGGRLLLDGRDVTGAPSAERRMGIVFQNYALFENMTVLGNVEYALRVRRETRAGARRTALAMLERMGLSDHRDSKPAELSGGQQQRVAIARTLVLQPEFILFDEPMSALDVATRLSLRRELKGIQSDFGTTMIYVTHDQEEAFALSDRIMVMNEARIAQLAAPAEILSAPADEYVRAFVLDNLRAKIDSLARYACV